LSLGVRRLSWPEPARADDGDARRVRTAGVTYASFLTKSRLCSFTSTLSPFRTPLQQIEGGELLEERLDVACCHGCVDRETLGHPRSDLVAVRLAVQRGPDE
jgi:hypothetical protein